MDLEGLAGEDRQMRREGERRIRCNVQCLNAEVGPKTVFMQQSGNGAAWKRTAR